MATATVVAACKDAAWAYLAASVAGDGPGGSAVEYLGRTPLLNPDGTAKPLAQLKTELVAACKGLRDARAAPPAALAITGPVVL